jgi:hypothetical protein
MTFGRAFTFTLFTRGLGSSRIEKFLEARPPVFWAGTCEPGS